MEVFVIHIPHNSICRSDGDKENRHQMIKQNWSKISISAQMILTIIAENLTF